MLSRWEKVSGEIMEAPHPWHDGGLRKRKLGRQKSRPEPGRLKGLHQRGMAQLKAPENHSWYFPPSTGRGFCLPPTAAIMPRTAKMTIVR